MKGVKKMPFTHNPVGWFEIPVTDMTRAKAFYQSIFAMELQLNEMGAYQTAWFPMFPGAIGATGMLIKGDGYSPSLGGVLIYFTAPDIEATLSIVEKEGGKVLIPKKSIGEHGFIGIFQDTEGNRIGLHSRV